MASDGAKKLLEDLYLAWVASVGALHPWTGDAVVRANQEEAQQRAAEEVLGTLIRLLWHVRDSIEDGEDADEGIGYSTKHNALWCVNADLQAVLGLNQPNRTHELQHKVYSKKSFDLFRESRPFSRMSAQLVEAAFWPLILAPPGIDLALHAHVIPGILKIASRELEHEIGTLRLSDVPIGGVRDAVLWIGFKTEEEIRAGAYRVAPGLADRPLPTLLRDGLTQSQRAAIITSPDYVRGTASNAGLQASVRSEPRELFHGVWNKYQPSTQPVRIIHSSETVHMARAIQPDALHDWESIVAEGHAAYESAQQALERGIDADHVVIEFCRTVRAATGVDVHAPSFMAADLRRFPGRGLPAWVTSYFTDIFNQAVARYFPYCPDVIDVGNVTQLQPGVRIRVTGRHGAGKTSAVYEIVRKLTTTNPGTVVLLDVPVDETLLADSITGLLADSARHIVIVVDDVDRTGIAETVALLRRAQARAPEAVTLLVSHTTPTAATEISKVMAIFRGFDHVLEVEATKYDWTSFVAWVTNIVGRVMSDEQAKEHARLFLAANITPHEAIRVLALDDLPKVDAAPDESRLWQARLAELAPATRRDERLVLQTIAAVGTLLGNWLSLAEIPDALVLPFLDERGIDRDMFFAATHSLAHIGWIGRTPASHASVLHEPQRVTLIQHNYEGWVADAFFTGYLSYVCQTKDLPTQQREEMLKMAWWLLAFAVYVTDTDRMDAYRSLYVRVTNALIELTGDADGLDLYAEQLASIGANDAAVQILARQTATARTSPS
jgi:hypothetical protein